MIFLSILLSSSCGRFSNEEASDRQSEERWVGLSKQYKEILYALGAQDRLVAVDLSSTYPPEIKELPTVGYHRPLSAEGVLGVQPTLILHDNNVGPEQVMEQLRKLEIPEKFDSELASQVFGVPLSTVKHLGQPRLLMDP